MPLHEDENNPPKLLHFWVGKGLSVSWPCATGELFVSVKSS